MTEKVLARGATLDATYKLAHDEDNSGRTCTLMQDMSSTVNHIGGDVTVIKLEFEALKVMLMEIRDIVAKLVLVRRRNMAFV